MVKVNSNSRLLTNRSINSSKFWSRLTLLAIMLLYAAAATAEEFDNSIPMKNTGASTYSVPCSISGYGDIDMMVDTGSSYMTINEQMLRVLEGKGLATYVKKLDAKMADGSSMVVPVYRLASVNLGGHCKLNNVEAAVLPGASRNLLGLSVLNKAGPFIFSVNPPELVLSHCSIQEDFI